MISKSENPLAKFYESYNKVLHKFTVATYPEVIIDHSLDFSDHVPEMVNRSNEKSGFLKP